MDIFSNRPLFTSCMLFLAWSTAGFFLPGNIKLLIMIIAIITLIFMSVLAVLRYHSSKKKNIFLFLILSLVATASALGISYSYFDLNHDRYESSYNSEAQIQGTVSDVIYDNDYASTYKIDIEMMNGKRTEHMAILECEYSAALQMGDRIAVKAIAIKPEKDSGRYNERLTYMSEGIFVIYSSGDLSELSVIETNNDLGISSFFASINQKLSGILKETVKGNAGDLSSALLLGNKDDLSDPIVRDFRRVGASHILALSGLHMSLIMGAFVILLKRIIKKSNLIAIIASLIAVSYLALTGFSISAMRSVIMLLIAYLSTLIDGVPDSLTSLSLAGAVIIILSPGAILDAGFWMSFASTFGILTYVSPINEFFNKRLLAYDNKQRFIFHKIIYSVITAIATSIAALLPLIIVMCIFIKEISVLSILSSVVLSVPTAIMIILSLILLPLYQVPYLSNAIAHVIRAVSGFMIDFCTDLSEAENIVISLNYPFAAFMAIALGATLFISCVSKIKNPFLSLIPFAMCLAVFIGSIYLYENTNKDNLNVAYINASSNSDLIVLSSERQAVICDISNGSLTSYEHALDEINESRATEIKAIMLTRYTHQHNATLYKLFRRNKVREIWVPQPNDIEEYYKMETLFGVAKNNNVLVYLYTDEERINVFEHTYIEHDSTYIERSSVPIDLIDIYTGTEHLTYISPAFNESDLYEKAMYSFSKSDHIIFGSRGPRPKSLFGLGDDIKRIDTVTFSDKDKVAYFEEPNFSFITYYLVPKENKMEFFLTK